MIKLELSSIRKHLKKRKFSPIIQKNIKQILVTTKFSDQTMQMYFTIDESGDLLQIMAPMPYKITKEAMFDTARWLHLLNKDLDLPGFCMDAKLKMIFYRCVIPCHKGEIANELLKNIVDSIQVICYSFLNSVDNIFDETSSTTKKNKKKEESKIIKMQ